MFEIIIEIFWLSEDALFCVNIDGFFSGFLRSAHNLVGPSQSNISMLLKAQAAMLCSSYPFHREDRQARKVLFDGKTVLIGLKRGLKN